ncbi:MAG: NUDIX hydrolase [Chloroflexi bacterium]|nr:NUDIX hydrolase [Chloroflexota bacterium]
MATRGPVTVAAGAVVVREQRVLLVRLAYSLHAGKYMLPGGYVEPQETAEMAAIRETREETGVSVHIRGLLGMRSRVERGESNTYCIFLAGWAGGEPRPDGKENDRAAWFTVEDLERSPHLFVPLALQATLAGLTAAAGALPAVASRWWPERSPEWWQIYLPDRRT